MHVCIVIYNSYVKEPGQNCSEQSPYNQITQISLKKSLKNKFIDCTSLFTLPIYKFEVIIQ